MRKRWIFPANPDSRAVSHIQDKLGLPDFLAGLLVNRGFDSAHEAEAYINPRLRALTPPEILPDIPEAVARLTAALHRKERIVIYGDYDVDGVTSLAILTRFLRAYGADPTGFLPHRVEEGYGLSELGVKRCIAEHSPQLLIAVDCGTNSINEIAELRRRGVDVIVLDHHEPGPSRPDCAALVNPKCGDSLHYLCSAGVVFKLAHAMLKASPVEGLDLRELLDLVAMATVADIVPLIGENRIFVSHGLRQMENSRWPGLRALQNVAGVGCPIRAGDIGFRMGPRINAAGRLGPANEALSLLLTDDSIEAHHLASTLDARNRERQALEKNVVRDAENWVETHFNPDLQTAIVAGSRDWHVGVIGVVAARLMRQYHRPAFVIGFDHQGSGKGSGRSIAGLPLVSLLDDCSEHLEKYGGHDMAAGITISESRLDSFREAFESASRSMATDEMLSPKLDLDCEVPLAEIGAPLLETLGQLEPFGNSNSRPLMVLRGVTPSSPPRVMKEKHLRIDFNSGRKRLSAVYFNAPVQEMPRPPWDIAFTLDWNNWQGRSEPQLQIVEVRSAE
jgi:single-stranded-DNA-specific exonuclease